MDSNCDFDWKIFDSPFCVKCSWREAKYSDISNTFLSDLTLTLNRRKIIIIIIIIIISLFSVKKFTVKSLQKIKKITEYQTIKQIKYNINRTKMLNHLVFT